MTGWTGRRLPDGRIAILFERDYHKTIDMAVLPAIE